MLMKFVHCIPFRFNTLYFIVVCGFQVYNSNENISIISGDSVKGIETGIQAF